MKFSDLSYDNEFVNNPNSYTVTAGWNITFVKSAYDLETMTLPGGHTARAGLLGLEISFRDFNAGDVSIARKNFPFLRTEKGWIVQKLRAGRSAGAARVFWRLLAAKCDRQSGGR